MESFDEYFEELNRLLSNTFCDKSSDASALIDAVPMLQLYLKTAKRIFIIGNGGSASIASHCASHYTRGFDIDSLNDPSALTATANDFGYVNVYAKQLDMKATSKDLLIAVSSSGQSRNILYAAEMAKRKNCCVVTFSGFSPNNPLRQLGNLNFYVPSEHYGHVELTHMALLHAAFDLMEEK